jgi:hypothetical protein
MSLRGKDFRCELDAELHEQLRLMAEHQNKTLQQLGAELLEKAVVGEFHAFRLMAERLARCGIARNGKENRGKGGA